MSSPRLAKTPFRSPQLLLFDLGPHEWLLYWRTPDHTPARSRRRVRGIVQLPLFDPEPQDMTVGADAGIGPRRSRTHLHLVEERAQGQGTEE